MYIYIPNYSGIELRHKKLASTFPYLTFSIEKRERLANGIGSRLNDVRTD